MSHKTILLTPILFLVLFWNMYHIFMSVLACRSNHRLTFSAEGEASNTIAVIVHYASIRIAVKIVCSLIEQGIFLEVPVVDTSPVRTYGTPLLDFWSNHKHFSKYCSSCQFLVPHFGPCPTFNDIPYEETAMPLASSWAREQIANCQ